MLELRSCCENCGIDLPFNSSEARICSFECTFCAKCVEEILQNVCPNCYAGFEKRPIRGENLISKYPASIKRVLKPVNVEAHKQKVRDLKGL